jgi:hypothetical protein
VDRIVLRRGGDNGRRGGCSDMVAGLFKYEKIVD